MSHWASTWAYEQQVKSSGRKFVLVALANFADESGFCYPSQARLAAMTGQTDRSVRTHLAQLEEDNLIKREHRYEDQRRATDGYRLQAPVEKLRPAYRKNLPVQYRKSLPVERFSADLSVDKDEPSVSITSPTPPKKKVKEVTYLIADLRDPDSLAGARNELSVYGLSHDVVYQNWFAKYLARGGIGRKGGHHTAEVYLASLHAYFQVWLSNKRPDGPQEGKESRNVRNIRESLEYLKRGRLPGNGRDSDHQDPALLLLAGAKP